MNKQLLNVFTFIAITVSLISGCKKDDDLPEVPPTIVNESENITTIKIIFTDSANSANSFTAAFKDPDGDGGNGPTQFDTIKLMSNKTYYTSTEILDDSKNPPSNITEEIKEEQNDHQIFYTVSGAEVTITYDDQDTNNPPQPVGLTTRWRSGNASYGTVKVILKHQPGSKDGNIATGDTDIEVTFQTIIQ